MNSLESIGLNDRIKNHITSRNFSPKEVGRIFRHDKTQYIVKTLESQASAELTGNLLHSDSQLPVVGDWVKVIDFDGHFIITELLPRYSQLARRAVSHDGKAQLIAANIDQTFIVQSADHNFNLNRLERYIAIAYEGGIEPIVVLNKIDLISSDEQTSIENSIRSRVNKDIMIISVSAVEHKGVDHIETSLKIGTTSCFLGSSGVGKSTIVNLLLGTDQQLTSEISNTTGKGRHTTTSRQLFVSRSGGLVIDTPGMRELGVTLSEQGLETSFTSISEIAMNCKFSDCTHQDEPDCAVQEAVINGDIDVDQLDNYHKLRQESLRFQKTKAEMNKEGKRFGRMYKEAMAHRKSRKP